MEKRPKGKDSKVSRSFLRMVLKEQGQKVSDQLDMNSWEMVDLIIKNIHLVDIEVRNLRKENKKMHRELDSSKQRVIESIEEYYREKRRNGPMV